MLKTLQEKQKYIQQNRLRNYQASLALEGIAYGNVGINKAQLKEKYKKLAFSNAKVQF